MTRDEANKIAEEIFNAHLQKTLPYRSQVDRITEALVTVYNVGLKDANNLSEVQQTAADSLALEGGNASNTMLAVAARHSHGGFISLALMDDLRDRGRELRKRAQEWNASRLRHWNHALGNQPVCGCSEYARLAKTIVDVNCAACLEEIVSYKTAHAESLEKETLATRVDQHQAERRLTLLQTSGLAGDSAPVDPDSPPTNNVFDTLIPEDGVVPLSP